MGLIIKHGLFSFRNFPVTILVGEGNTLHLHSYVRICLTAIFLKGGARVFWQILWIRLTARCWKAGSRLFSFLGLRVGSSFRCFLMRLKVFWLMVHFLPVPFFQCDMGQKGSCRHGPAQPQEGLRDLKLLPNILERNPSFPQLNSHLFLPREKSVCGLSWCFEYL
jgi:hypothetical protein